MSNKTISGKTKMPQIIHALSDVTVKVTATDEAVVGHYSDKGGIEISPKQSIEEAHHTLCHELIHYALSMSGAAALLGKLTPEGGDALEESIVVAIENFLIKPGVLQFNAKTGSDWKTVTFLK